MNFNKRILYTLLTVAVVALFVSSRGFRNLIKRKSQQYSLEKQINRHMDENARLREEIYSLKNDKLYVEYLIRRNLGYIKPDEVEYRFIKKQREKYEKSDSNKNRR